MELDKGSSEFKVPQWDPEQLHILVKQAFDFSPLSVTAEVFTVIKEI